MHQTLKQLPVRAGLWAAALLCTADGLAQAQTTTMPAIGYESAAATTSAKHHMMAPSLTSNPILHQLPSFSGMAGHQLQHSSLPRTIAWPPLGIPTGREPVRSFRLTAAGITIPLALIGIGASGLSKNSPVYHLNHNTAHEIREDHPHFSTWVDDYLKYVPAVATVGLEAAGVKGRHTAAQTAVIAAISLTIMYGSTETVKRMARETRPDGSDDLSFPSGHTATAFASAELMRLEFRDTHPVLAWSGYMAAVATGALRMYKQRHFTGDVAAGAGFGILSTEAAYLIYPVVQRVFSPAKDAAPKMTLLPQYNTQWKSAGLAFSCHF